MMEIERKILGIDKGRFLLQIKQLKPAPKKLFEGLVRIKYFDFPDHRIHKKHDLLRLREFAPVKGKPYVEFVYKQYRGIRQGCKHLEETEFVLHKTGFKEFAEFLNGIGLMETLYYEKKRTHFSWEKVKFELDEHPKIPAFLEIEAPSPAHINKVVRALGLEKHEQTADSISSLMKRKYPKIKLNGLKF